MNRFGVQLTGDQVFFTVVNSIQEARDAVRQNAGDRTLECKDCRHLLVAERDWMLKKVGRYPLETWDTVDGDHVYWIWEVVE